MNRDQKDEETRRSIQIIILMCYNLYSIGIAIASITQGWELWVIPVLFLGSAISFSLYASQQFVYKFRIFMYAGFISLATFYYGIHLEVIYNVPLIIVLAMLLFSLTEEKDSLRIFLGAYAMIFFYHAILMFLKMESVRDVKFSEILLSILSVLLAHQVAGYVCELLMVFRGTSDQLEEELETMKAKSEDFMANISHELRTPINVVIGLSEILLKDEKSEKKRVDISSIQSAGRRLFGRIEDILDYTEIDTGSLILSEEDYRISSIINDIVTDQRSYSKTGQPELIVDMDVNIPSRMVGDAARIKRIIKHLVVNATKFNDENGCIYLKVFTRPKEYGVNLCIEVTDTGIGMSQEELFRVKNAAYQLDSGRNRKAEGIGLGLSIVYGFTAKMGGFVILESEEKKGTSVTVTIPQKVSDARPSVAIEHKESINGVVFTKNNKFASLAIREYYNTMISNILKGLGVPMQRVSEFEELKKAISKTNITHVFIAEEEYLENKKFFDSIDNEIYVVTAVSPDFKIPKNSNIVFVRKPVYSHSLVSALNRRVTLWEFDPSSSGKKLSFEGLRALVVDDEDMNLMVAKGILSGYGIDVTLVRNGLEAVHECEASKFDVIFMDHMMPGMDGVEAMKLIRNNQGTDNKSNIIAFSANAVSGVREMFMEEGFDEFLPKPIDTSELERVLKKLLPSTMWKYVEIEVEEEASEVAAEGDIPYMVSIDTKKGLEVCRNNESLYKDMLMEFAGETDEIFDELQDYYEKKDWLNYSIKLNGLKLSARIIGAEELSNEAKEIERAAKEKWEAYIIANHDALKNKLDDVSSDIIKAYGGGA